MAATTITFTVDAQSLGRYTDTYIAQLWHIAQANPAPYGDADACEFAEHVGREIVRRWVSAQGVELWTHQGVHMQHAAKSVHCDAMGRA